MRSIQERWDSMTPRSRWHLLAVGMDHGKARALENSKWSSLDEEERALVEEAFVRKEEFRSLVGPGLRF